MKIIVFTKPVLAQPSQSLSRPLDLEARLAEAINEVADLEFVPYLEEAWRCFNARAYNAAGVWIYCAVSCYIKAVVKTIGEDIFEFRYYNPSTDKDGKKKERRKPYEGLDRISEIDLIDTCEEMGILTLRTDEIRHWLSELRVRRNFWAHGNWDRPAMPEEVVGFAENVVQHFIGVPVASRQAVADVPTLVEFAKAGSTPISDSRAKTLVSDIADQDTIEALCRDLFAAYRLYNEVNYESVRCLWNAAYRLLQHDRQENIHKQVIGIMADSIGLRHRYADRRWQISKADDTGTDTEFDRDNFSHLVNLELWAEPSLPDTHRDGFYRILIHFLEAELVRQETTGEICDLSNRTLTKLRLHAPTDYRLLVDQLVTKLQGGSYANPSS